MTETFINRRDFMGGAAVALFGTAALGAGAAQAQSRHPLSRLTNIRTGQNYAPQPGKYPLALFMTGQEINGGCGLAFIGIKGLKDMVPSSGDLDPVLVMPPFRHQPDPQARENVIAATDPDRYGGLGIDILTGDFNTVLSVANHYGSDVFEVDRGRQVITNHTLDAFLTKSQSGETLLRYPASDYIGVCQDMERLLQACRQPRNAHLCL